MKKIAFYLFASCVFCGCLSPVKHISKKWVIGEIRGEMSKIADAPKRPSVKIARIEVCAPYDETSLVVMRSDGSVAFDPYNAFASAPSRLLSRAVYDILESSGFAETVLDTKTSVQSPLKIEIIVTRLALDCRKPGRREASVCVMLRLLESRNVLSVSHAEASAPTDEADYSKSFSIAFTRAMSEAIKRL